MDKILLILLALLLQQQVTAQKIDDAYNYKATYDLSYLPDSTNLDSRRNESMVLYIGDNISRFSSWGTAVGDSLMANAKMNNRGMADMIQLRKQMPETRFSYNLYKVKPSGKIYYTEKVARDNLLYEEELELMNWEIENETRKVAGYQVQKASTTYAGRNYTAWFTTEIPISDGPYKFSGLPGLIVELSDEKNQYSFKLNSFQNLKPSKKVNFDPNDHMKVDKKEFRKIKKNYELDPIAAFERAGITIHFTPAQEREAKKELEEKRKRRNNPLELE